MIDATPPAGETPALRAHPARETALVEVHARPISATEAPRRLVHYAFLADHEAANAAREALNALCARFGVGGAAANAKQHVAQLGTTRLRFEQHGEFLSYTFQTPLDEESDIPLPHWPLDDLEPPGDHVVAAEVLLSKQREALGVAGSLGDAKLVRAHVFGGAAEVVTDFRAHGADGVVRYLARVEGLSGEATGLLARNLIEIETYRTLALLALPTAQQLGPEVRAQELELAEITAAMSRSEDLHENRSLLGRLTGLAARVEASVAGSSFRFGAARAYIAIVEARLESLREEPIGAETTLSDFLTRRMHPALSTISAIEARQESLSVKISRTAQLLRTRVFVEQQEANRVLLASMDSRTRLQLRLQQTVEGLSVAAISYYVVSLIAYLAKSLKEAGLAVNPTVVTGLSVPLVVLLLWWAVRRIRAHHADEDS
ncbi:MAG: DUF3422 domain-containing protein [Hyphomicrobiaceae bacterium]|nr:DUF3422 domain-containing protein [Hyphomicrobiaceae bacterium]